MRTAARPVPARRVAQRRIRNTAAAFALVALALIPVLLRTVVRPVPPPAGPDPARWVAKRRIRHAAMAFALVALVLNGQALLDGTRASTYGWARDANIAVLTPIARVVSFLGLDRPRRELNEAFHPAAPGAAPVAGQAPAGDPSVPANPGSPTTIAAAAADPGTGPAAVPGAATTIPAAATVPAETPIATVPVAATPTATVPADAIPAPAPRIPSAADKLRVLIVGDSFMESLGASIERALLDTGVAAPIRYYKPATGLSRPDVYDWPLAMTQSAADLDPEVVIVMLGGNDAQNLVDASGAPIEFGTDPWIAEYAARVGAMLAVLAGRSVYWIGLPPMRSGTFSARVQVLDRVYEAEAAVHPGAHYVSTWEMFGDANGGYQTYLPGAGGDTERVRAEDGVHFSRAGADWLSALIVALIQADFGVVAP